MSVTFVIILCAIAAIVGGVIGFAVGWIARGEHDDFHLI